MSTKVTGCIFCGSKDLSKEHLWSKWTYQFFPKRQDGKHKKVKLSSLPDNPNARRVDHSREYQGDVATIKVRAVCKKNCNNGWMNRLEGAVKPILTDLMRGDPRLLAEDDQRLISAWAAMKVAVSEFGTLEDPTTTQADREHIMDTRTAPPHWSVWIAAHDAVQWRAGYMRHAVGLGHIDKTGEFISPIDHDVKNTQFVVFGVGRLLLIVLSSNLKNLRFSFPSEAKPIVRRISPFEGKVSWPPLIGISDASIDNEICRAFSNYLTTIRWVARPSG